MREGGQDQRGHHDHRGHWERRGHEKERVHSAQTFRRGRAIAFLEKLHVKRSTLLQQLGQPEYDSIKQVITGELKAVDAIIQEFIHTFELREAISDNNNGDREDRTHDDH